VLGACLIAAVVSVAPLAAQAQSTRPSPLRAEIDSLNRAMERAFASKDMLAVARFYADDAVIMGPRGFRTAGRTDIDNYWKGLREPKTWKLDVLDVGGHRDDAWQLGRSTLVTGGPDGDRTSVVNFVVIWKRQADGSLRMALDFYN
jgi:uncharacterized protein (TIGR02246 family)